MDDQPMLRRVDGWNTGVMAFVMERGRRQRADGILNRCEARTCFRRLRVAAPADRLFKRRPFSIRAKRGAQLAWCVQREGVAIRNQQSCAGGGAHPKYMAACRSLGVSPATPRADSKPAGQPRANKICAQ